MKLFGSINKTENVENVPSFELLEVVLVEYQHQQISINKSLRYYIILCQIKLMSIF